MDKTGIASLAVTGVLIILDWLTGLAKAVHAHDISSEKLREGLWHKSAYVLLVILAETIERGQAWIDLGIDVPLVIPACVYICLTETASIIENIGQLNPDLNGSRLLQLFRSTTSAAGEGPKHKKEE